MSRCICCNKIKDSKDRGRVIVEPDNKISAYCMECDLIIWERLQPKMLGDALTETNEDETASIITEDQIEKELDRYD